MVSICPLLWQRDVKLQQTNMQIWPKVKLGQVQVGSNIAKITHLAHRKSYMVIIGPNSHEKLTKSEIR